MSIPRRAAVLGCLLTTLLFAERACAQLFDPGPRNLYRATEDYLINRPTVSPYLNLLRRESDVALPNYHTLVRPQLDSRQEAAQQQLAIRNLQSRVSTIQGQFTRQREGSQPVSGHPTRFMTYLHYFPGLERR